MSVILNSKHHCKETLNLKNNSEFEANMSVILTSKHHCKETLNVKNNSEFDFDRSFAPPSDVFESLQGRIPFSLLGS